ncbi:hypothetical protein AQUCO_04000095v1 [Aquilegia coerulea]|uniref:Uncharacterized protein n=1 Tax=Aquilegia coerulea TaxID=218851 RepID=A0A2G5CR96_AQUCA|nr:hypothetical protein AQUCO_04000095v1 [Aquilegia coerulea]
MDDCLHRIQFIPLCILFISTIAIYCVRDSEYSSGILYVNTTCVSSLKLVYFGCCIYRICQSLEILFRELLFLLQPYFYFE